MLELIARGAYLFGVAGRRPVLPSDATASRRNLSISRERPTGIDMQGHSGTPVPSPKAPIAARRLPVGVLCCARRRGRVSWTTQKAEALHEET